MHAHAHMRVYACFSLVKETSKLISSASSDQCMYGVQYYLGGVPERLYETHLLI
jgi:hypothetical protein